jgi:hypothetical protein
LARPAGVSTRVRSGHSQASVTFSGPFFETDIGKTFRQNVRMMLEGMAREGEGAIKSALPHKSGDTAAGVVGRVHSLTGKPWALTAVISQSRVFPWVNHRSGRGQAEYRGGRLEARQHQFRRVTTALRRARAVAVADLTRGMN